MPQLSSLGKSCIALPGVITKMQFKNKFSPEHTQHYCGLRLILIVPVMLLLTSCTTTFIPGLDRVLFANSSAKVGPIINADQQYPTATMDEASASSKKQASSELEEKANSSPKSPIAAPTKPTPSSTVIAPTSSAPNAEPSPIRKTETTKAKPITSLKIAPKAKPANRLPSETIMNSQNKKPAMAYGVVTGNVSLVGGQEQRLSVTGTMITLTPKTPIPQKSRQDSLAKPKVHVIDMEDKTYQPLYSTINAGDQVVFVNKDNIRHNVFSSSGNNAFDLGTYGSGLKRAVTLKEPGIVKIYCNIHSDMAAFVAVGKQGLSVQADDQGRYQINMVPPGTYELSIWNIRGESKRTIVVKANETNKLVDRIDIAAFKAESHKNKFGGNYSKNSNLFEDEFY